jgi:hypothetical protein
MLLVGEGHALGTELKDIFFETRFENFSGIV